MRLEWLMIALLSGLMIVKNWYDSLLNDGYEIVGIG